MPVDDQRLTFAVSGQMCSMPASCVQQIVSVPRITRVPHAPEAMMGLANIRGDVVPILSLSHLLHQSAGPVSRIIVVEGPDPVGIAVQSVSNIVASHDIAVARHIDVQALIASVMPKSAQTRRSEPVSRIVDETIESDRVALVSVAVGTQEFAFPLSAVEGVLRLPEKIAVLPHGDPTVVGSILANGDILPLLSLQALLGFGAETTTKRSRILVVPIGGHRIGLVVDAMRDILHVSEADIDAVPEILNRSGAEARIQAIGRIEDGRRLISILAVDQLVREDITARLLQGDGSHDRKMEAQMHLAEADDAQGEQFLLFQIGDESFGLPIASVEEVVALPSKLTALPRAPEFVLGVISVRGDIIPVIDQAVRFKRTASAAARRRIIIVRIGDLRFGFLVDSASEILRAREDMITTAPQLRADEAGVFDRVVTVANEGRMILILSPQEMLDRAERDVIARLVGTDVNQAR
jgi:purine-binding chemotaxis protein CheW